MFHNLLQLIYYLFKHIYTVETFETEKTNLFLIFLIKVSSQFIIKFHYLLF